MKESIVSLTAFIKDHPRIQYVMLICRQPILRRILIQDLIIYTRAYKLDGEYCYIGPVDEKFWQFMKNYEFWDSDVDDYKLKSSDLLICINDSVWGDDDDPDILEGADVQITYLDDFISGESTQCICKPRFSDDLSYPDEYTGSMLDNDYRVWWF